MCVCNLRFLLCPAEKAVRIEMTKRKHRQKSGAYRNDKINCTVEKAVRFEMTKSTVLLKKRCVSK
jgi:hypothetical protein